MFFGEVYECMQNSIYIIEKWKREFAKMIYRATLNGGGTT